MEEYFAKIKPIPVSKQRRKEQGAYCTLDGVKCYQGLAGSLNFFGRGLLPQVGIAASYMQQMVPRLRVNQLVVANKVVHELTTLKPSMTYLFPSSVVSPTYPCFSDASHGKISYGQTGYISGIYLFAEGERVYHIVDWLSCKQSRVSFSSISAEILAAAHSTDRTSLMADRLQHVVNPQKDIPLVPIVDSNGIYTTLSTLHEGSDYRLRPTVARLRDSFETGENASIQWVPGVVNLADALMKQNIVMFRKLNQVMSSGRLHAHFLAEVKRRSFDS